MAKANTKKLMKAAEYARQVNRRGGPERVAVAVGLNSQSVRKRMAGVAPVDGEAEMALALVPVVGRAAFAYPLDPCQTCRRRAAFCRCAKP